jgi:hypothetical protein
MKYRILVLIQLVQDWLQYLLMQQEEYIMYILDNVLHNYWVIREKYQRWHLIHQEIKLLQQVQIILLEYCNI